MSRIFPILDRARLVKLKPLPKGPIRKKMADDYSIEGDIEGVCPFCPWGFNKHFETEEKRQEIYAEWEGHILSEHNEELIEYYLDNTDKTKRDIVLHWSFPFLDLGRAEDVECPYCGWTPPEKYESSGEGPFDPPIPDPWRETKHHIADEHMDEFWEGWVEWSEWRMLALHEMALELAEENYVEADYEETYPGE